MSIPGQAWQKSSVYKLRVLDGYKKVFKPKVLFIKQQIYEGVACDHCYYHWNTWLGG